MSEEPRHETSGGIHAEYEAPEVERVMDRDELGRELLYAGDPQISSRDV